MTLEEMHAESVAQYERARAAYERDLARAQWLEENRSWLSAILGTLFALVLAAVAYFT